MKQIIKEKRLTGLGSDWFILGVLAFTGFVRTIVYVTDSARVHTVIHEIIGLAGLSIIWLLLSIVTALSMKYKRIRRLVFAMQVALHVSWSIGLGTLYIQYGWGDIHNSAISYGLIAVLIIWGIARTELRAGDIPDPIYIERDGDS